MGLFGGFRAKFKSNKQNKRNKSDVVCTKYKIYKEFDSNPTHSLNEPTTSYTIKQGRNVEKFEGNTLSMNGAKTTTTTPETSALKTAPIEIVDVEYTDRDIDNFKVHIVNHTDDRSDDDDSSEELNETPTTPLQYSSQAASIFFGSDDHQNRDIINNNHDNISHGSSASA